MMPTTTQEKIAVMQAHVDGKTIQVRAYPLDWAESYDPRWNWTDFEYRVAPEILKIYIYRTKEGGLCSSLTSPDLIPNWTFIKTIETEI